MNSGFCIDLIDITKDLASGMLLTGFLVIHDSVRGGENQVTELTGRQEVVDPLFNLSDSNVEARRDDSALVDATNQVDDDLSTTVVINDLELADVF